MAKARKTKPPAGKQPRRRIAHAREMPPRPSLEASAEPDEGEPIAVKKVQFRTSVDEPTAVLFGRLCDKRNINPPEALRLLIDYAVDSDGLPEGEPAHH